MVYQANGNKSLICTSGKHVSLLFLLTQFMSLMNPSFSLRFWNFKYYLQLLTVFDYLLHFMFSGQFHLCLFPNNSHTFVSKLQVECYGLQGATGYLTSYKNTKLSTWFLRTFFTHSLKKKLFHLSSYISLSKSYPNLSFPISVKI